MREKLGIPNTSDHQGALMTDQQQTSEETRPQYTEKDGLSASELPASLYESERSQEGPQESSPPPLNLLTKFDKKLNGPRGLTQSNESEGEDTTAERDQDPAKAPVTNK